MFLNELKELVDLSYGHKAEYKESAAKLLNEHDIVTKSEIPWFDEPDDSPSPFVMDLILGLTLEQIDAMAVDELTGIVTVLEPIISSCEKSNRNKVTAFIGRFRYLQDRIAVLM
jgi:hypothetical protein